MKRLAPVAATGGLLLLVGASVALSASPAPAPPPTAPPAETAPPPTAPPAGYIPTAEDAAKAAAEQLALLPPSAVQVDCNPVSRTNPPYFMLAGRQVDRRFFRLADGRCFFDPLGPEPTEWPVILIEIPSGDPGDDAP